MSNNLYRINGLQGVKSLLSQVCKQHLAISEFKIGKDFYEYDNKVNYPLSFMEWDSYITAGQVTTSGVKSQIYNINLFIADLPSKDATDDDVFAVMAKVEAIADEVHYQLSNLSPSFKVSPLDKNIETEVGEDGLVVCHCEFQIETARSVARNIKPAVVVLPIVKAYGTSSDTKFTANITTSLNQTRVVKHRLDSKNILVQFYQNGEMVKMDYSIIDFNTIKVLSTTDVINVDLVIYALHEQSKYHSEKISTLSDAEYLINHNLDSDDIIVQFRYDTQGAGVNYIVVDNNTISITTDGDINDLDIIIASGLFTNKYDVYAFTDLDINHNLNTEDLLVQFYHNNERVMVDYKVTSLNSIRVELPHNYELDVVIFGLK